MGRPTPTSIAEAVCILCAGATGALLRYLMSMAWPAPHEVLRSTVLTAGVGFLFVGFTLGATDNRFVRALVLTTCGAAASLSAYSIIGVGQTPWLAAAFLILSPVAALAGLAAGLFLCRAVRAQRETTRDPAMT